MSLNPTADNSEPKKPIKAPKQTWETAKNERRPTSWDLYATILFGATTAQS